MADTTKSILTAIVTTKSKLPELTIKNGQFIFIKDAHRLALDFNDKRVFYNRIVELDTESDRTSLSDPEDGIYYYVISTYCLWRYQDDLWVQLTSPPEDIVIIGEANPTTGSGDKLYVDTTERNISVWDGSNNEYLVVADTTNRIEETDIENLFN